MSITRRTGALFVALQLCLLVTPLIRVDAKEFKLECHMLPVEHCAFAVDSEGYRCILEKTLHDNMFVCQTSDVPVGVESPVPYVENEECIAACGTEKMTVGFSTDIFLTRGFTTKLCSTECREDCPNLADLYSNMVAGEGSTLAELCSEHRRSMMMEAMTAPGPAPAPSPASYY